jgi:hypothetical protein
MADLVKVCNIAGHKSLRLASTVEYLEVGEQSEISNDSPIHEISGAEKFNTSRSFPSWPVAREEPNPLASKQKRNVKSREISSSLSSTSIPQK